MTRLEQLYQEHNEAATAIVASMCRDRDTAEDAIAEAWIVIERKLNENPRFFTADPRGYLITVAKREAWRQQRGWTAAHEAADLDAHPADRDTPAAAHRHDTAHQFVELVLHSPRLKPNQRRALGALLMGYSYREMGEMFDWTHTQTSRFVSEGKRALRELAAIHGIDLELGEC